MAFSVRKSPKYPDPRSPMFCANGGPWYFTAPWKFEVLREGPIDWQYEGPWNPNPDPFLLPNLLVESTQPGDSIGPVLFESEVTPVVFPNGETHTLQLQVEFRPTTTLFVWNLWGELLVDGASSELGFIQVWIVPIQREYAQILPNHINFVGWTFPGGHVFRSPTLEPRRWDYELSLPPSFGGGSFDKTQGDRIATLLFANEISPLPFDTWQIEWKMNEGTTASENQTIWSAWNPSNVLEEFSLIIRDPNVATTGRLRLSFGGATQGIDWYEWIGIPELFDGNEHTYKLVRLISNRIELYVDDVLHSDILHTADPSRYVFPNHPIYLGANRSGADFTGVARRFVFSSPIADVGDYHLDDQTSGTQVLDFSGEANHGTLLTSRPDPDTFWSLNL